MSQSRNWVFTRQATEVESALWLSSAAALTDPFSWHRDERVKFCVYQIERAPTTGQLHVQGLICFSSPRRLAAIKTLVGNNPHCEACKSVSGSITYCSKAETRVAGPWTHGDPPAEKGKKICLADLYADIKSHKRTAEMLEANPDVARYEKALKFMKFNVEEGLSDRQKQGVKTYVFWGATDLGKTYSAINLFCPTGDYYILGKADKQATLWFDGYDGQRTLIIDDFSSDVCSLEYLKRVLDVYKLNVPIKGGFAWAQWTQVIITSNYSPLHWFHGAMGQAVDTDPLKRRIYEIRHFTARGKYVKESFEGEPIGSETDVEAPATASATATSPPPSPLPASPAVVPQTPDNLMPGALHDPIQDSPDFVFFPPSPIINPFS